MANKKTRYKPVVLSIAGYDPSSGAGITADIKTIGAHGCYGISCITALTVQSTRGVLRVDPIEGRIITETLEELAVDFDIAAVKIGMLGSAEVARAVAAFLKRHQPSQVVLDPILKSSFGAELISKDGIELLKSRLLAQATVITPNIAEAAALSGMEVNNREEMERAALRLQQMGANNVIITGGHLNSPTDLILLRGQTAAVMEGGKIVTSSTHGTGCAYSTSLACGLAKGKSIFNAATAAKRFVEAALHGPAGVGTGVGPIL
ncbi:MAG TPA: bifunctional hydroxymethylpyrimidine kinase/phosphomethylpyrimidine kinase [Candidatus Angelobacter sp.]|nr:bifunctional hydroxymethylpyrimidine kinase/phosphomethylpyrimidine kinase [Candidatus Angelobacter sp.]